MVSGDRGCTEALDTADEEVVWPLLVWLISSLSYSSNLLKLRDAVGSAVKDGS
eukprot:CAMPEP_0197057194 /NCGR_PEP_ID=MMETSP1384-20130603/94034_1 /TAXON_ID=29189 /ORGANISM="Ammonia sp." /LENGTH=52 /DNA_ID=CAMNT_0042491507 /DNA_START=134 /DNA_END=288 /DNA_ORIENTATION=+